MGRGTGNRWDQSLHLPELHGAFADPLIAAMSAAVDAAGTPDEAP